jgi:hypothetical protein
VEEGYRPWALDFTPDDAGNPPYPFLGIVNPYANDTDGLGGGFLRWTTDDWDPALRFWTLPYDRQLNEWLKTVDPSRTYIMAGREFGGQPDRWQFDRPGLLARGWLEPGDLGWQPDPALAGVEPDWTNAKTNAWSVIRGEIEQLQQLMQDDRERYLPEADAQADGGPQYVVAYINANTFRYPWTTELINCGLSIGNIAYSYYKEFFSRVRPSFLCPGLTPPFGPPQHPSFPSGHSFLGHLFALLLLEIPALAQRYGIFAAPGSPGQAVDASPYQRSAEISVANPAIVTSPSHGLQPNDAIGFQTTGTLPSPIAPGTPYFVLANGLTLDAFRISLAPGGTPVRTQGAQSGTHVLTRAATISIASPAVVTFRAHGLQPDDAVIFQTTGTLPPPIAATSVYYVLLGGLTANTFHISGTPGGAAINTTGAQAGVQTIAINPLRGITAINSPLLWLAQRLAKNRERIGVHYASDSMASRHLAAGVWRAILHEPDPNRCVSCPTLEMVVRRAQAEWPA